MQQKSARWGYGGSVNMEKESASVLTEQAEALKQEHALVGA
jgi:hypothetical protein